MNFLFYIFLALGAAALALFLVVRVKKGGVLGMLTKLLTSVFFVLTGAFAFMANPDCDRIFGIMIITGTVFGLIGDVLLDLKYCYPKDNDIYTFSGMAAFALGHICYLFAIYNSFYVGNILTLVLPIVVGVVFACAAVFGGPMLGMKYGKFKVPSLIYAFLLSFMLATNLAFLITTGGSLLFILMSIAAFMFIASDLALSQTYFVYKKVKSGNDEIEALVYENKPAFVIFIHITYYVAQFLFAAALFVY